MPAIKDLLYQGFSVEKAIGEIPKLDIKVGIDLAKKGEVPYKYIYVGHLNCKTSLCSTAEPFYTSGYSLEGDLGTFIVNVGRLLRIGHHETVDLIIPLTTPKVDKFLEIRHKRRFLGFDVEMSRILSLL